MELVYPIYLDVPMMTGFLASLEDGIIEEAELENRLGDSNEKSGSIGAKLGSSGFLRGLLEIVVGAEGARKVAESVESSYKGIIRYPTSALFVRLRNLLLGSEGQVKALSDELNLQDINTGDLVEFSGTVRAHPAYQIQSSLQQLLPVIGAYFKTVNASLEQDKAMANAASIGETITVQTQTHHIQNKRAKETLLEGIESKQKDVESQIQFFDAIGEVVSGLLRQDIWNTVIVEVGNWKAICRIYVNFIRNERVEELHDANWTCMGKVIGKVQPGESFDLLKGMPIGYLAKGQFIDMAALLSTEQLRIEINESEIKGPALIIAAMAIFS